MDQGGDETDIRKETALNGLRCLALIGWDEEALGVWSAATAGG